VAAGSIHAPDGGNKALEFVHQSKRLSAVTSLLEIAGSYHVEVHGRVGDGTKDAGAAFAVNVAPSESDFTMMREAEMRALLPGVRIRYIDVSTEAEQADDRAGADHEIWRLVMGLLLALFICEFILATPGATTTAGERTGIGRTSARLIETVTSAFRRGSRNAS
jgi:hypothetical protein